MFLLAHGLLSCVFAVFRGGEGGGLASGGALGAGAGWAFREPLALMLYARGAEQALTSNNLDGLPDGLHAAFCGTGSPMPDPDRAGPCLAVIAGKRLLIVDAGEGAARNLQLMGLPPGRVERVLLTHFHSDHIDGLGALALQRWVGSSATAQLPLLGPVGVGQIAAGFNAVYQPDSTYRVAHHGEAVVPPSGFGLSPRAFAVPETTAVISDDGGLKVTAIRVDHRPVAPAVGCQASRTTPRTVRDEVGVAVRHGVLALQELDDLAMLRSARSVSVRRGGGRRSRPAR